MTGKILIVDDAATNRLVLRTLLERDYYTIFEAEDGEEALTSTAQHCPDLILLDIHMPKLNGLETCRKLKSQAETANIPVVMITSSESIDERHEGLQAGADDFLAKPINQDVLFARVRNLLRVKSLMDELQLRGETAQELGLETLWNEEFESRTQKLMLVTAQSHIADDWLKSLPQNHRYEIAISENESEALALTNGADYDALIVGEDLADAGVGLRLIANLRANWKNRDLTILYLAQSGTKSGLRSLEFGANDYMIEPFDPTELSMRLRTQTKRIKMAKNLRDHFSKQVRLSVIDPLTELHNRRYFDDYLPKLLKRADREQRSLALMILDLDHFKNLNDSYGHEFGDAVLVEFSRRTRENMRAADMIVRFGGEEFVIITPGVSLHEAEVISKRLCKLVSQTPFETRKGEMVTVTVSIGATMVEPGEITIDGILRRADEALYKAKETGRNRVCFAEVKPLSSKDQS